jgi:hypothetical protein
MVIRVCFATIAVLAVLACYSGAAGDRAPSSVQGPRIAIVDSVRLVEVDTAYVGQPMALSIASDGGLLISDGFARRVLNYSRSGRLERIYGRAGHGPGEFVSPGISFPIGDSVVAVDDFTPSLLQLFDSRSAKPLRQVRHRGYVFSQHQRPDTVWLGAVAMASKTGVARWLLRTDEISSLVPIPRVYEQVPELSGTHPIAHLERWLDTMLVGFSGHHALYLTRGDGGVIDSLDIPYSRRRGVPRNLGELFTQNKSAEAYFSLSSLLSGIHRNADSTTTLVYFDQLLRGRALSAVGYVTLLSADRRSACVDGQIPVADGIAPRVAFSGDTIVVLAQHAVELRGQTTAYWFVADVAGCKWIPTTSD